MNVRQRSRFQQPPVRPQTERFKRPLVVLIYRDGQLDAIHSSTPSVQFVRMDVALDRVNAETSVTAPATQVPALALTNLSLELRLSAQRAFRRSAYR